MAEDMCKTAVRVGALAQRSMRTFRREALPPSDDEWEVEDRLEVLQKAVGTSTTSTTSSTRTNTNTDQHRQYCSYYYYYYYYCQATTLLSVIAFAVFGQTVMEITRASRHRGYVPEMKHGETYAGTVSPCRVVISNTCTDQCIAWQHGINDRPSVTKHAQTGTTVEDWALLVHSNFEAMLALISTQQEILRAVSSSGSMESQLTGVQRQLVAVNSQLTRAATILASLDRAAAEQVVS